MSQAVKFEAESLSATTVPCFTFLPSFGFVQDNLPGLPPVTALSRFFFGAHLLFAELKGYREGMEALGCVLGSWCVHSGSQRWAACVLQGAVEVDGESEPAPCLL